MKKVVYSVVLIASFAMGCGKSAEKPKDAPAEKPAASGAETPKAEEPKAPPAAEKPLPKLTMTEIKKLEIQIGLPEGAAVGEITEGDASMEMPDSVTISTEKACGFDVDVTRHWKKSLDSMYTNGKKMADGLEKVSYLTDEKTDAGFTVHYKGKTPLGEVYGMSTGLVVGDRLVLCDSGMGRQEAHEAACVLSVCKSITAAAAPAAK